MPRGFIPLESRSRLPALALWLALLLPLTVVAQPAAITLADGQPVLRADALAGAWLDERGTATLEEVLRNPARLQPFAADTVHPLGEGKVLWVHLRLQRAEGSHEQWLLAYPNPLVDRVDVWQADERGRWRMQSAGDSLAVSSWPEMGRYPVFRLELPPGQPRDIYLRLRSAIPTSTPVRLSTDASQTQRLQLEYLGLGAALGALLILVAACAAQSWAFRDRAYAWYAGYMAITTLCLMSYTGVSAHLLWPGGGLWPDAAPGVLAFLAGGAAMLFVRRLTAVGARNEQLNRITSLAGWCGVPLAAAYVVGPRPAGVQGLAAYLCVVIALSVAVAALAWRRRDLVGLWVLGAFAPLAVAVAASVMRLLGVLPISFFTQYAAVIGVILQAPLLLVALLLRSRDRHAAQIRGLALSSQDALTGLLAPHLFRDRLHQVVARYKRHQEDAAVVLIDLVNYPRIKAVHGSAVAEQSVLRSVLKLRRVVRDVDTVGRIGEARFGLILEGATARTAVTHRAARLIAAGLMPLPGLKPDVTLQFHIAGVVLRDRLLDADALQAALVELVEGMSPRTRRPIRFLEPEVTQPVPLDTDSELAETRPPP